MDNFYINQLDETFRPNHEPTDEGYFTESDYQELQRNLILYKEGSQEAITYIVRIFHPFITKYTRFIINGDLPYSKYIDSRGVERCKVSATISRFVSLFIEKKGEETDKKKLFSSTCMRIKTLFSKYEYGDIYNELVLALLNMANKYKITTKKWLTPKGNWIQQKVISIINPMVLFTCIYQNAFIGKRIDI